MKRALITGITGMDGSHLADLLLGKGYEVHGVFRRCSRAVDERLAHIADWPQAALVLHDGDLTDQGSLDRIVAEVQPDEVYNLGAQSFVGASWRQPVLTAEVTGLGALRMLEAVYKHQPEARFYQASSSEMFGNAVQVPQDEMTPLRPRSPYGSAKVFAHNSAVNYRESYDMFVSCGILFNHESERRGFEFVTRKISRLMAEVACGKRDRIQLGNTSAQRDWGYAPDYVEAMWLMLQYKEPDDFVVATGETHSVQEFLDQAWMAAGKPTYMLECDSTNIRPAELHQLRGRPEKIRDCLGWTPTVGFKELVRKMVYHDMRTLGKFQPGVLV